jgi:hypothetical protein
MHCGVVSASPPLSTLGLLSSFTVGVGSYMEQKEMLELSEENVFLVMLSIRRESNNNPDPCFFFKI